MAELRHLITYPSGVAVRVYEEEDGGEGRDGWFYMTCETCGACSQMHPDELEVCKQAFNHAEGHEAGTA